MPACAASTPRLARLPLECNETARSGLVTAVRHHKQLRSRAFCDDEFEKVQTAPMTLSLNQSVRQPNRPTERDSGGTVRAASGREPGERLHRGGENVADQSRRESRI